jgi:hypothetical protein
MTAISATVLTSLENSEGGGAIDPDRGEEQTRHGE